MKFLHLGLATLLTLAVMTPRSHAEGTECRALTSPASYYNPTTKAFFLAVNSCTEDFFKSLGLVLKAKKDKKPYANTVDFQFGFGNNAFFYSSKLKTIYEAGSEDNRFEAIVRGLGLTKGQPEAHDGFTRSTDDLVTRLRVCCEPDSHTLISCADVAADKAGLESEYRSCLEEKTQIDVQQLIE